MATPTNSRKSTNIKTIRKSATPNERFAAIAPFIADKYTAEAMLKHKGIYLSRFPRQDATELAAIVAFADKRINMVQNIMNEDLFLALESTIQTEVDDELQEAIKERDRKLFSEDILANDDLSEFLPSTPTPATAAFDPNNPFND